MAYIFFIIYVIETLFLGTNVKQSLGMNTQEGFLGTIHYYSLPFLFLTIGYAYKRIHFNITEKRLFLITVIYFIYSKIIGRSANLGVIFNILVEPICVLAFLRSLSCSRMKMLRILLVVFFVIECGIALYEATFNTIIFAKDTDIFDYYGDIRAYSLHGHPLQNAFIVCMLSVVFISSKLGRNVKFGLFLLGYLAIFTFNTRSSIYIMGCVLLISLFKDYILGKGNRFIKAIGLCLAIFAISYAFNFIMSHSLGTRLESGISTKDGSSMARFLLINAFSLIPIEDLLFGVDPSLIKLFMYKYGLVGIENSIVSLVFYCGAIFSFCYFPLMFKDLYLPKLSSISKWLIYGVLFLLLNVNNALVCDGPVLVIPILSIYAFLIKKKNYETVNNCSSI